LLHDEKGCTAAMKQHSAVPLVLWSVVLAGSSIATFERDVRRSFLEANARFHSHTLSRSELTSALKTMERTGKTRLDRASATYALALVCRPSAFVSRLVAFKNATHYTIIDEALPRALFYIFTTTRDGSALASLLDLRYDGAPFEEFAHVVSEAFLRYPNTFANVLLSRRGSVTKVNLWLQSSPGREPLLWALVAQLERSPELSTLEARLKGSGDTSAKVALSIVRYIKRYAIGK
jgi:hypothetical protein